MAPLAEVDFWNNYWTHCKLPSTVNEQFSFDRCLSEELLRILKHESGHLLEIGCAPGRWLAFLASNLGLTPNGIEYSAKGTDATRKNFNLLGIEHYSLIQGDFFELTPDKLFNVVMSLGFIEHFEDSFTVIDRHLAWLHTGGLLVLGIPNFQGVNKLLQKLLDNSILEKHNLSIMNLDFFRNLSKIHNVELTNLRYLGSFEPALPMSMKPTHGISMLSVRAFLKLANAIRCRARFFDKLNGPKFSSYIIASYRKK